MLCPPSCAVNVPKITGAGCRIVTRPAGIDRVVIARCDLEFTDITDLDEWDTHMTADKVHATGKILGQKPKGSLSKRKLASCVPERPVNATRQISWRDANADNTAFTEYDFYNTLQLNSDIYMLGWVTCDDLFYGWATDWSVEVDDTRGDNSDEEAVIEAVAEYKSLSMIKPVKIVGLRNILV